MVSCSKKYNKLGKLNEDLTEIAAINKAIQ